MTTDKNRADAQPLEITEQMAAEWADRNELENVLTSFSTQRNAIEDARTLHLLAAPPVEQPASLTAKDALAAIETFEIVGENNDSREPSAVDRFILTAFIAHAFGGYPVEQSAAAPCMCSGLSPCERRSDGSCRRRRNDAPSPADERAALGECVGYYWIGDDNRQKFCGSNDTIDSLTAEKAQLVYLARAASATKTGAEGAIPAGYALVPVVPTTEMLGACKQETWIGGNYASRAWKAMIAAAPRPAQADARVGLTFDQWWSVGGWRLVSQAGDKNGWRGAAEAGYIGGLFAAAAAVTKPEPRAEVTDDDKVCADRYRWVRAHYTRLVAMPHEGSNVDIAAIGEIGDDLEGKALDLIIDAARTGASS